MGQVNFYLKKAEKSGRSLIYLQYLYNGRKLTFSTGQTIVKRNWNSDKQRVKSNRETTKDGKYSLNDLLDNLETVVNKTYNAEVKNGIPEAGKIKTALKTFVDQNKPTLGKASLFSLIERFISKEIKFKGKDKSDNTVKAYISTRNHLREYEGVKKIKLDFDSITLDFYFKFLDYLYSRKSKHYEAIVKWRKNNRGSYDDEIIDLGVNTVGKYISKLKLFMKLATQLKYTTNTEYLSDMFVAPKEETHAVYLTEAEIEHLFRFDYKGNKRLEQVVDLFVFGCHVGLRFQDYTTVLPSNIVNVDGNLFIKMITGKTRQLVIIPCAPIVLEIFAKYKNNLNKLPHKISNQKFNDYIKEACKEAGLIEAGRLITRPSQKLYEVISSHTCRRSFASNYFLQGFPTIDLMKITGHKSEKAFLTYIKVSNLDTAKRLNTHMKKRWVERIDKVTQIA